MGNSQFVEGDLPTFIYGTGHECADCSEELLVTDEVVLVQIVLPALDQQGRVSYPPFLNPQGEYAYDTFFFHQSCWMGNEETLRESLEDEGLEPVGDQYSFCGCTICQSGIRLNEPSLLVQPGEMQSSQRSPNNERALTFVSYTGQTELWCLSCTRAVNDEVIEMWDSISYQGECVGCTHDRNWRIGEMCHHEQEEEDDE